MHSAVDRNREPPSAWALWNLGFRPFYLAAGLFAAIAVLLWTAHFAGWISIGHLAHPYWHAHEMVFGYALAVITGFLFTAVRNWTNLPTPAGGRLAAIVLLWAAARIMLATPWPLLSAAADMAFMFAVAAGIGTPLIASGNRRNLSFIALLAALAGANLAFHLAMSGRLDIAPRDILQLALNLVAFLMALMAGRVIPMFTSNAIPGTRTVRNATLERVALASLLVLAAADLAGLHATVIALIAGVSAVAHAWRLALWAPLATGGRPILWILHTSYAWIVLYLALRALAGFDLVSQSVAIHALAVGALGGLTLGMMTRTARGHTGRPLEAGRREITCYVLIHLAALVRVFGPIAAPSLYREAVTLSGLLWTAAFIAFVSKFWTILVRPRADGRPG